MLSILLRSFVFVFPYILKLDFFNCKYFNFFFTLILICLKQLFKDFITALKLSII